MIVLVDRARDERLGELVRHLRAERPETDVLLEAPELSAAPEGSCVVLRVRAEDRTWLNLARPVVAQRTLRLFLWSTEATTVALVQGAVDFFDWISHRVECPDGPPGFAVRELRRIAVARPPALAWYGPGFERAFELAFPKRRAEAVSAALPYPELVRALRPGPRAWVAVRDVDRGDRLQRTRWACAEAGRFGRTVLVDPLEPGDLPAVDVRATGIDDAAARLREAGAARPARLAALLNLSEKGVQAGCALLKSGVSEAEIEARISLDGVLRPASNGPALARGEPDGKALSAAWPRRLPGFAERVKGAFHAGDFDVARAWAARWSEAEADRAEPWIERARLETWVGDLKVAGRMVHQARVRLRRPVSGVIWVDFLTAQADWECASGELERALSTAERGLGLSHDEDRARRTGMLVLVQVTALRALHRLKEAGRVVDGFSASMGIERGADDGRGGTRELLSSDLDIASVQALILSTQANLGMGIDLLRTVEERLPERHGYRAFVEAQLGWLLFERRQTDEALALLRRATERESRLGGPLHLLLCHEARALVGSGRMEEAESASGRSLQVRDDGLSGSEARVALISCLLAQGRTDDARVVVERLRRDDVTAYRPIARMLEANVLAATGKVNESVRASREALGEAKRLFDEDDRTMEQVLLFAARTLLAARRPRDAEPPLRRAIHLARTHGHFRAHAEALRLLAAAQRAQGFAHATDTERRAREVDLLADVAPDVAYDSVLRALGRL